MSRVNEIQCTLVSTSTLHFNHLNFGLSCNNARVRSLYCSEVSSLGLAVSTKHEQENTGTTEDQRVGRD